MKAQFERTKLFVQGKMSRTSWALALLVAMTWLLYTTAMCDAGAEAKPELIDLTAGLQPLEWLVHWRPDRLAETSVQCVQVACSFATQPSVA